ncbi:MAG TPA: recombination protein RecR [Cytophagales bacterium]|nr:recombination protein RecR [Cytophagales bacterium]HAA20346.1 recombination protein RecR [Cytophagales bacterium]HAP62451.1 recombination protein RecR [Cytophagales bacterium]
MEFPSKLIGDAVTEISRLPGIGKKSALRLVLHLLKQDEVITEALTTSLHRLRTEIHYCERCHNVADDILCSICQSPRRDHSLVCVVEDLPDVLAIENTGQYQGVYHVLGGVISPMEGVGPSDLHVDTLLRRAQASDIPMKEVILALSPTMEGDTTSFYLTKKLRPLGLKVTTIARGVPIGGELEYTDEVTLGRSILTRTEYPDSEE